MDAHHAAEPPATKRIASPASSVPLNHNPQSSTPTPTPTPTTDPAVAAVAAAAKADKPKLISSTSMTYKPVVATGASLPTSAAPTKKNDSKGSLPPPPCLSHDHGCDDDVIADNNSEAETIVLDGSPVKPRKAIKKEDTSDAGPRSHIPDVPLKRKHVPPASDTKTETSGPLREGSHGSNAANGGVFKPAVDPAKRKRLVDHQSQISDLDSVHAKPTKSTCHRPAKDAKDFKDTRDIRERQDRDRERERGREQDGGAKKLGDRVVSHKRKVPRNESDDDVEPEPHKVRRQRTSASIDASSSRLPQKDRDHPKISAIKTTHDDLSTRHRSTSPHARNHRRSASTQVASSSSGLSHKKKRIPPPLSTDYQSDASSGSGSPHIRSTTARGLATPATADSMGSANKNPNAAHKKHIDAHGQTQLAKACIKGDLDNVKKRLHDRRQDIDFPDYAGNTPLQFAAINGHARIVDFLIKQDCNIHCVNHEKDTPLLDAVENDHLEVIKILLDAGVNPRKANVSGQEPLDLVTDDQDNADGIREALIKAKKTAADLRRASTEDPQDAHSSHGADSPHRRSPSYPEPSSSRRAASSRSHKMSNKVLYMPLNVEALREAAGKGDEESVQRILAIKDHDDAESMVAAAKGGHDGVMNLLLAIGNCNPDPPVVRGKDEEHSTPMLAAIGQENCEVVKLLLMQSSFDPTKRINGETYYEIARKRAGPSWREEETLLKNAYDEYRKSHPVVSKKSPNRRDLESKRAGRTESRDGSVRPSKRKAVSPSREAPRSLSKAKLGDKEYKGTSSHALRPDEPKSPKLRGGSRPKKDETAMPAISMSDAEASPRAPRSPKPKRSDPDAAAMSSDGEAKPFRRRLLSRKEQQSIESVGRRGSMVSTSSSLRDPSSPGDTRHDEVLSEKYHDRAKSIKEYESRDKSRGRLSTGETSAKRSRSSATPDRVASEKEGEPVKKRRLDVDKKEQNAKATSPDRNRKSASTREPSGSSKHDKPARKHGEQTEKRGSSKPRKSESTSDQSRREPGGKSASSDKSIHVNVKAEDSDVVVRDADSAPGDESRARAKEDEKKRRAELEAKKKQKEKEAEEQKQREEEQRRQAEMKKQEEERKRALEVARLKQEDEARQKREAEDAQRKAQEELKKRQAEEARILRDKEELERQRKEEERIRMEKEAAEEARRKRAEDERREEERRAREELRQRQVREEQEQRRLGRLPASLRWLDRSTNAKTHEMAFRWRMLRGVRFDSIRPESAGTPEGREQWVLNTQVAMLLGDSDIQLMQFSRWERVPASLPAKHLVMGLARPKPSLTGLSDWDLGRQLPGYYLGKDPAQLTAPEKRRLDEESKAKFLALDSFFVKLSDLMLAIPNIPHLRNLEIVVTYHEVAETLEQHDNGDYPSRWKDDPDAARYLGYCPRSKYYVDGQLVREGKVDVSSASYTPWPDNRVPREGLTAVAPTDPKYARLAKEQGLEHLLFGLRTPPMTVAAQTSPNRLFSQRSFGDLSPPPSESTATANGDGHHQPRSSTSSTAEQDRSLVNGTAIPFHVENGTDSTV